MKIESLTNFITNTINNETITTGAYTVGSTILDSFQEYSLPTRMGLALIIGTVTYLAPSYVLQKIIQSSKDAIQPKIAQVVSEPTKLIQENSEVLGTTLPYQDETTLKKFISVLEGLKIPSTYWNISSTNPNVLHIRLSWRELEALAFFDEGARRYIPAYDMASNSSPYTDISMMLPAFLAKAEDSLRKVPQPPQPSQMVQDGQNFSIANALREAPGLCIGEKHLQTNCKEFLIDHMDEFKANGVTTLFMEFLMYDTMQPFLDEYFASPGDEMPPLLKYFLRALDFKMLVIQQPGSYTNTVIAAKKAGIRVVGIDTSLSMEAGYSSYNGSELKPRCLGMNYVANDIIVKERGDGKFIAFMGGAHLSHSKDKDEADFTNAVPGIADLTGSRYMLVTKDRSFAEQLRGEYKEFHSPYGKITAFDVA